MVILSEMLELFTQTDPKDTLHLLGSWTFYKLVCRATGPLEVYLQESDGSDWFGVFCWKVFQIALTLYFDPVVRCLNPTIFHYRGVYSDGTLLSVDEIFTTFLSLATQISVS